VWLYFNFWPFGNNSCAFLHQLHENKVLWQKFIVLYGSFWIIGDFAFIYNAVYVERRNEIKDKVRIKLERLLTEFTLIYISNFFIVLFLCSKNKIIKFFGTFINKIFVPRIFVEMFVCRMLFVSKQLQF
jgi:hypothetical protein